MRVDPQVLRQPGHARLPAVLLVAFLGLAAATLIAVSFLVDGVSVSPPARGGSNAVTPTLTTTGSPLGEH